MCHIALLLYFFLNSLPLRPIKSIKSGPHETGRMQKSRVSIPISVENKVEKCPIDWALGEVEIQLRWD